MEDNVIAYPDRLYKHRFLVGGGEYVHIVDDIYEDVTCSHYGGKCRIRVKKVGDHFEFVEPVNDIAKEYVDFHKHMEGDTYFFPSKARVNLITYNTLADEYTKRVEDAKDKLAKATLMFHGRTKPKTLNDQNLETLDFDSIVYVIDENNDINPQKVKFKKYGKDGVVEVETPAYYIRLEKDNPKYLRAMNKFEEEDVSFKAFVSSEDAENFLLDENYEYYKKKVDDCTASLEREEKTLADIISHKMEAETALKTEQENS